ncbi:MAG: PIN domain-containing protein [Deltaproteobacteria bacterium]|nr:PIN domain-containing protein [Deltaproteobacteria bacterium]
MAGVIDTNIFLYGANADAREHRRARAFLQAALESPDRWYTTEGIVYEFLRAATHPKVFDRPLQWDEAFGFLSVFLGAPNVSVLSAGETHWELLDAQLRDLNQPGGNLFFDVRTAVLMKEHGVREIYTADTDFLQFADVRVVNPLRDG